MEFNKSTGKRASWRMAGLLTALFLGLLLLAGCRAEDDSAAGPTLPAETARATPDLVTPSELPGGKPADAGNGERIYFTATNEAGERITYRGGPDFGGMMMGSYLTCAACHGPEAQGGRHIMHMQVMDAPAISYRALSGENGEPHAEDGDEHGGEAGEYTLENFRLAVVEGQHPDGEPLDENMPRWNLAEEDMRDLFAFLKELP